MAVLPGFQERVSAERPSRGRENGSVTFPMTNVAEDAGAGETNVTLATLGRDGRLGLAQEDWVEIVDDGYTSATSRSSRSMRSTVRSGSAAPRRGLGRARPRPVRTRPSIPLASVGPRRV